MAVAASLQQSGQDDSVPFITVQRDHRDSVCWVVVGRDVAVRCYSGDRAMQIMEMMCRSRGLLTPD
jgi:hypothetical protein